MPRVTLCFAILLATVAGAASPAQTQQTPPGAPQAPAAQSAAPCVSPDVTTSLALLDRMQRVLDDAVKNEMGKVSLNRPAVDELRAEVAQIRMQLQPVNKP
jgi:hypothetical protein